MENKKTLNEIHFGKCNATKICSNCGKETSIIKSTYKTHLWKYWGFCDHCGASQIEYKTDKELEDKND